ncbi:MAG: LD-carboxypeptidase [Bacteroidales bacterium]|jgi:muramoyltetrapeptide carboxypeptidase|nr:LD-carboxypeptidase [Bacteroidales bacterium]
MNSTNKYGLIYPPFLHKNSKVAIVSPSGRIADDLLQGMCKRLKNWGVLPVCGKYADESCGRFAGTEKQRLTDLQWALDAPDIDAIFCSRGGYGCVHLIDKLNWKRFHESPKWLIGYSDITILLETINLQGFASIHAPMARHFSESREEDDAMIFLQKLLFGEDLKYRLPAHSLNRYGKSEGILTGGNLSIICSLRGTVFDQIRSGRILFIEDTGEEPYRIERMMYSLKLSGILGELSGLIIGQFSDYTEDLLMLNSVYEIIANTVAEYAYPVCFDFPVGHVTRNYPLMCGGKYSFEVNADETELYTLCTL